MSDINSFEDAKTSVTPSSSRGKFIGFWTKDDDLYEKVTHDAACAGLTVSEYLRELTGGVAKPRRQRSTVASKMDVGKFMGQLGRVGNNLNQLSRQANQAALIGNWAGMPATSEVLATLVELGDLLSEIQLDMLTAIKDE